MAVPKLNRLFIARALLERCAATPAERTDDRACYDCLRNRTARHLPGSAYAARFRSYTGAMHDECAAHYRAVGKRAPAVVRAALEVSVPERRQQGHLGTAAAIAGKRRVLWEASNWRMESGGLARNRTGVRGFAVRCVTTPPRGLG